LRKNGTDLVNQIIRECLIGFRDLNSIHMRALMNNPICDTNKYTCIKCRFSHSIHQDSITFRSCEEHSQGVYIKQTCIYHRWIAR